MIRSPRMAFVRRLCAMVLLLVILLTVPGAPALATGPTRTLVPIGSGYISATLQQFAQVAVNTDRSGNVYLLMLPITFASDPYTISEEERLDNLLAADRRRQQLDAACVAVKRPEQTCQTVLAPILVRDDAFLPANLALFNADLDGIYILGGDQTVAMRVVADTPTEQLMETAYNAGAVVGGNSAGAAVESLTMIAGYIGDNGPENGLQRGSVDLWTSEGRADTERGLIFGLSDALLDQHAFQRGRIGRLLNASWQTGLLGIGVDAETGAAITNAEQLTAVAGRSAAIVIDTRTYGSSGRYAGPTQSLAISRVATHLIPPGGYGYDLCTLRPLVNGQPQAPPRLGRRSFAALRLPEGYGPLLLGGDLSGDRAGLVADRFVRLSGGRAAARLVVLATGYANQGDAAADAEAYAAALQSKVNAPVQALVLRPGANEAAAIAAISAATGVLLTAPDQSVVLEDLARYSTVVTALHSFWQRGGTLLADNAAAAALGQLTTATAPRTDDIENEAIASFRPDSVTITPGLAFLRGLAVEPGLMTERRWGQLYNLLYRDSTVLALGIDVGTALELTSTGARVHGTSAVVLLDGRFAQFGVGSNGALAARYVLLDSFVAGDRVR